MSNLYTRLHRIFSSTNKPTSKLASKTPTQNQTITEAIKDLLNEKNPEKLLQKFVSQSKYGSFRRQHKLYEFTVHRLLLAKRPSLIEQALETQKKYISGPAFATRIIHLYGKAGMFEHAHKVFDELPERKCAYGPKCLSALLGAGVHSQRYDVVYQLFRELPLKLKIEVHVDCYNVAAHALCKLCLFDEAVSLLDEMAGKGLNPNVVSFNTLMCTLHGKGEFAEGERIWERMIECGVRPDICSYNFKLRGLVDEGGLVEAIQLVEKLKMEGPKPNVSTYNALICGFCKNDDLQGVKKWYGELLKNGCVPNRTMFSMLVPYLCEKGDYGFAFEVCKKKLKQLSSVDEASLQNVVDGLVKNSMMEEAKALVELGRSNIYSPYELDLLSTV